MLKLALVGTMEKALRVPPFFLGGGRVESYILFKMLEMEIHHSLILKFDLQYC